MTESQRSTIVNCLRVAADRFKDNAHTLSESHPRLAEQFIRQAEEAKLLALELEEGGEL